MSGAARRLSRAASRRSSSGKVLGMTAAVYRAYSLRRVNPNYSGNVVKIRRSSDNATQDIGFSSNDIDLNAVNTFVGGGSAYVVTWYDQSGEGWHLTQAIQASQPRLINAGVVDKIGTRPAVVFDGVDDFFSDNNTGLWSAGAATMSTVMSASTPAATAHILNESNNSSSSGLNSYRMLRSSSNSLYYQIVNSSGTSIIAAASGTLFDGTMHVVYTRDDGSVASSFIDGVQGLDQSYSRSGSTLTLNNFTIGATVQATTYGYFAGALGEVIAWKSALSAADRQLGEANQTAAYTTVVPPTDPNANEGYLAPFLTRPTGTDYVQYEDLVQVTDDVTTTTVGTQVVRQFGAGVFQNIIQRCPANKWITFPAGVFEINTPGWNIGDSTACQWPKTSYGAIGNCPPGTSWDDLAPDDQRTVFRVKEYTAPLKNVAGSWFKVGYTGSVKQSWANIHFEGTEQGFQDPSGTSVSPGPGNDGTSHRIFTNFFAWRLEDGSSARDILSTGCFGNNGAPPGESFNFQWYHSTDPVLCRINTDGRRAAGGLCYSAVGITFGNTLNGVVRDSFTHHNRHSGLVFFQTANCRSRNCVLGDINDKTTNHVNSGVAGNVLNHERTTGNLHYNIQLNCYPMARSAIEHVSHSNDSWTLSRPSGDYPIDHGTLKLINPTWSKILFSGSGYPMALATWVPYSTGNTMMYPADKPLLVRADETTPIAAKYNYGGTWYDI